MTRDDIDHIAQCLIALRASVGKVLEEDEHSRMIDRFLWAIHSSKHNPNFDEAAFRRRAMGENIQRSEMFPKDD